MSAKTSAMTINRSDLRRLSYTEFGCLLDVLTANVVSACTERHLRVDVVAPILRSGGITGCHIASKLGVTAMVPLQYTHTYDPASPIRRQFSIPTFTSEPQGPVVVLVADTNTVTGEVARYAARDLRMKWSASTILFASVVLDLSIEQLPDVDMLISAQRSNERRTVSLDNAMSIGVSNELLVFPWEDIEEQWSEIQAAGAEDNYRKRPGPAA
jgi:hypothetical protein